MALEVEDENPYQYVKVGNLYNTWFYNTNQENFPRATHRHIYLAV